MVMACILKRLDRPGKMEMGMVLEDLILAVSDPTDCIHRSFIKTDLRSQSQVLLKMVATSKGEFCLYPGVNVTA